MILFKAGARAFFVHGFAKNERANIRDDELAALWRPATELLPADDGSIARALRMERRLRSSVMSKQYSSPLMASVHETAEALDLAGVMDRRTMREFDDLCLTPVRPLAPDENRALRLRAGASQTVD